MQIGITGFIKRGLLLSKPQVLLDGQNSLEALTNESVNSIFLSSDSSVSEVSLKY